MAKQQTKPPAKQHRPERRVFELDRCEIRAADGDGGEGRRFFGHASVFDSLSEELWGFYERVAPDAFDDSLAGGADVRLLFNHDPNLILARTKAGTLQLERDEQGLVAEAAFPETSYARDLAASMDRGDVDGMSFGFRVLEDEWDEEEITVDGRTFVATVRTLLRVELFDVSIVVYPAYPATDAELNAAAYRYLAMVPAWAVDQPGATPAEPAADPEPAADQTPADPGPEPAAGEPSAAATAVQVTVETEPADDRDLPRGRLYERSVEFVRSTPWLIHPDALATILGIMAERAAGVKLTVEEIWERLGTRADDDLDELFDEAEEEEEDEPQSPVAVIPVRGPIVPRGGMFTRVSGMTSVQQLQDEFRAALADPKVKAVVFDIDSPGGSAALIPEFATEIREARGTKPIVAVANAFAASAAYFIASAADEVVVTPSGQVGSIGAYAAHEDWSKYDEELGVKTTLISAGKYKVEGNPFEPLSDEAKAEIQEKVDAVYELFIDAVAAGRGVARKKVLDDFGQGRMVLPADALNVGMVDRIATIDETLARLAEEAEERAAEPGPFAIRRTKLDLVEKTG